MSARTFPVLMNARDRKSFPDCPRSVPWAMLAPHEEQAKRNHDQGLEVLASRGGLGAGEMVAVLRDVTWREVYTGGIGETRELVDALKAAVIAWAAASETIDAGLVEEDERDDSGRVFVANADGTFTCEDCLTPEERGALGDEEVQVWEEGSRGWTAPCICARCALSIPVYLDGEDAPSVNPDRALTASQAEILLDVALTFKVRARYEGLTDDERRGLWDLVNEPAGETPWLTPKGANALRLYVRGRS